MGVLVVAGLEFLSPYPCFSHIVMDRVRAKRHGGVGCPNDNVEEKEDQEDQTGSTILMVPRPDTVGGSAIIIGQYRRNTNCSCRA